MSLEECELDGKPGWRNGPNGTCHTYDPKAPGGATVAKARALKDGVNEIDTHTNQNTGSKQVQI